MFDNEHKSFLLCWSKSRVGYDSRLPELCTPKISDIHSTTLPLLNSLSTTHSGEFFIKLLHSFTQNTSLEENYSVLYLMNSVSKLLSDFGLAPVECIKRIHSAFQYEIVKWELMGLLFLLEILVKPEEFVKLISPSSHREYLTPIIVDILGFSISVLRSDTHKLPYCMSSPSRMNMMPECKDSEVESLRAKVTVLESEILRYQDVIDQQKHKEDTEPLQYSDIVKVYLDAIFQLEGKTAEVNSLCKHIEKLKKEIDSLNESCDILTDQNVKLKEKQQVLYNYETEITKLRQIQSQYQELQQTYTLAHENIKQLNDTTHELRIKLSISEAKNAQTVQIYQELQDSLGKNFQLREVIEDYEREIVKFKVLNAQRSISEDEQSSLNNTPTSIKQHEISNGSLYDDFQELIHSKEAEILHLKSKFNTQSVQLLTLEKQLQEASNQLSLKDEQLASYSKQIQDLQTSHHYMIKTPASQRSLNDLKLLDAESDRKLNEYRRRSSGAFTSSDNFELYSMKFLGSIDSKVTRPDTMFCIETELRPELSPIMSVKYSSDIDSEAKSREFSTIKEWPRRCWDYLHSVDKRNK